MSATATPSPSISDVSAKKSSAIPTILSILSRFGVLATVLKEANDESVRHSLLVGGGPSYLLCLLGCPFYVSWDCYLHIRSTVPRNRCLNEYIKRQRHQMGRSCLAATAYRDVRP